MYRISVTTLEKFRRYMVEASSYDTEEALLESIKGIFKGNHKTMVGGAFHKIIEGEYTMLDDLTIADGIGFHPHQAAVAIDYAKSHPLMVCEISINKVYNTSFFPIQVSGRIDGAEGLKIRDAKTKYRSVDLQEYIDSCQWKFYLDMLNTNCFYYDIFEVKGFDQLPPPPFILHENVQFIPHQPLECIRYEGMESDIQKILEGFLDYLHNRNIVHLLKPALPTTALNF